MTAVLTPLQAGWACLEATLAACLDEVDVFQATVDRMGEEADIAEQRLRGATIWPGPALIADLTPQVCDILKELTGTVWQFLHLPMKPMARIWSGNGPTLEISVDDMHRPRYVRVHTLWSRSGKDAWGETNFAACLVNSKADDPYAKVLVGRGADRIARTIAADVLPRAETLWPKIEPVLDEREEARKAHEAWAAEIAEALGDPHFKLTAEGRLTLRYATQDEPRISWTIEIDRGRHATFRGAAPGVDAMHPLITTLAALTAPGEPLALAAE